MALPNFIVIGDLKSGSTSIDHYLRQHPDVFMPERQKELRYFAFDPQNSFHAQANSYRIKTLEEYATHFDGSSGKTAIGEVSPNYLRSPTAAESIRQAVPDTRIVVSIRNPADRLFSTYLMQRRSGKTDATFSERLFENDANWIKGNYYWFDLKRFYDRFSRNRIHVIRFDDLKDAPMKVMNHLFQFLEVDQTFVPDMSVQNKGGMPKNRVAYASMVFAKKQLKKIMSNPPPTLRTAWSDIKERSLYKPKIEQSLRQLILDACRDDIELTQELTGCDLSLWFHEEIA